MAKINMVRREGGSRVISITRVIPLDWLAVDIEVVKTTKNVVTLKINRVK